jgi:hypothetical protein
VAEGHLTQEEADRMRGRDAEGFGQGARGGFHQRVPGEIPHLGWKSSGAELTELLGLTGEELLAEVKDGKTLADVAEAQGVELDAVVDVLMAPMTEKLAEAVEAGYMTQEQANEKSEQMKGKILKALQEGFPVWKPAPSRLPNDGARMKPNHFGGFPGQSES